MNIVNAPKGIVHIERPGQGILDMTKAGFENILLDLALLCPPDELEHYGKKCPGGMRQAKKVRISEHLSELHPMVKSLTDRYKEAGLRIPVARAPYLLTDSKRDDLNELLFHLASESIRSCKEAECGTILINPLFSGLNRDDEWRGNREFYLALVPLARENDVKILLKNQCRDLGGHFVRGICSDGSVAAKWIDALNEEAGEDRFGFCMDVGVCNLCGQDMHEYALALGKRVKAVILRDCNGHQESSLLPFTCVYNRKPQTDWLSLIRGLRETGFDGDLILDMSDTASVFSPLLRPQLLPLAKAVAEYFQWQIGIENLLKKYKHIVLFGAGNMCRNYMKCYGEKYPPLFTCDNNQKVWETSFCGLEVKAPDALRKIPGDCAIFICNIYYREIEHQLREMGIMNPIEYFNDEYLPSFYFDRLKGV